MLFLRPLHYSPTPSSPEAGVFGAGAHTDYGMLTILATDGTPGLQVLQDRQWTDVPHVPGAVVINLGDMAER
jgi:isopenicillin N synthase-like dioxygenase